MAFQEGQVPGPGRNSLLTPELRKQFVDALRTGLPRNRCCDLVGVHRLTLKNWEARAAEGEEPFASFFLEVQSTQAQYFHGLLAMWQKQMPEDWRAIEAFMKRHPDYREEMGDRSTTEITGANGAPLQVVLTSEEEAAL